MYYEYLYFVAVIGYEYTTRKHSTHVFYYLPVEVTVSYYKKVQYVRGTYDIIYVRRTSTRNDRWNMIARSASSEQRDEEEQSHRVFLHYFVATRRAIPLLEARLTSCLFLPVGKG